MKKISQRTLVYLYLKGFLSVLSPYLVWLENKGHCFPDRNLIYSIIYSYKNSILCEHVYQGPSLQRDHTPISITIKGYTQDTEEMLRKSSLWEGRRYNQEKDKKGGISYLPSVSGNFKYKCHCCHMC